MTATFLISAARTAHDTKGPLDTSFHFSLYGSLIIRTEDQMET
jgi:hypothetical protein